MSLADDLLGYDTDPTKLEEQMKNGGIPPEGKHHARLDGYRETQSKEKGTPCHEMVFTILSGPGVGLELKESVWVTENAKSKSRLKLFANRLGLLHVVTGPDGKPAYAKVPGKETFHDCIGAECIIDVVHEEYDRKDGKGKGKKAILQFAGIYKLDSEEVKDVPRAGSDGAPTPRRPEPVAGVQQQDWAGLV